MVVRLGGFTSVLLQRSKGHFGTKQVVLTGLYQDPKVLSELLSVYRQSRDALDALSSDYDYYRQTMNATLTERIVLLENNLIHRQKVESCIGEGAAEEILEQAKRELQLIGGMADWR